MWTKNEIKILKEKYPTTQNKYLISLLTNKKIGAIVKKANSLGLYKNKELITEIRKKNNPRTTWTTDEVKSLRDLISTHSNKEISIILDKTKRSVERKISRVDLRRSKKEIDGIRSRICKENGRDLSKEKVIELAKKYNSKHEFYKYDPSAYSVALKNKWIDDCSKHMIKGRFSIPQLMLKNLLEYILEEECDYENRTIIKPLEIDCYFDKWKIGWEYDGRYFHQPEDYEKKYKICKTKGVYLFNINEFNDDYRDYELNIKNQVVKQLGKIKELTGKKISVEKIKNYTIKPKFPNLLTQNEKIKVYNKKLTNIKKLDYRLYKRIIKYKLYNKKEIGVIDDRKKYNKFNSYDDYVTYLKNKKYKNFTTLCKYEHPHRLMKRWGLPIKLIHDLYEK